MSDKLPEILKWGIMFLLVCLSYGSYIDIYAAESQSVEISSNTMPQVAAPASLPDFKKDSPRAVASTPSAPSMIPSPPDFPVEAYILIDANSGYIIAEKNKSRTGLKAQGAIGLWSYVRGHLACGNFLGLRESANIV